jgi:hypothetical protein
LLIEPFSCSALEPTAPVTCELNLLVPNLKDQYSLTNFLSNDGCHDFEEILFSEIAVGFGIETTKWLYFDMDLVKISL